MNRGATMFGRYTNLTAGAADPNVWTSTLGDMFHNDRHAGNSDDKIRNASMRTKSTATKKNRVELSSLIQGEVESTI